ncbi:MAG: ABC transporter permease, partial [Solirubrobacteraceae bacterium]
MLVQVAVACVVLVAAALMTRSLVKLQASRGGYDVRNVLTARVDLNWSRYTTATHTNAFADRLLTELRNTPGVVAVSLSSDFPMNNGVPSSQPFLIRGRDASPEKLEGQTSDVTTVGTGFFATAGIPLVRGRGFDEADRDTLNIPAVIGQRLAATHWKSEDPLGQQISWDNGRHWATIVGISGDVRMNSLSSDISDQIYLPFSIRPTSDIRVMIKTRGDASLAAPIIRKAVHDIDDKQPVSSVQTLEQLRGTRLTEPRVTTVLLVAFAALALAITAAGLVGVVGQSVSQRMSEIGIRVALGASARQVLWSVMRGATFVVALGIV